MAAALTPLLRAAVRYAPAPVRDAAWSLARHRGMHRRPRRFTARTRHGFRIRGDQSLIMPRCLYWFGHWEPLLSGWLRQTLRPGDTFLDVGANFGYFSMLASRAVGRDGRVVALEPSPAVRERLQGNLRRNRIRNVRVLPVAAGAAEGTIALYRAPWNDAESSTIPREGLEHEADVPVSPVLRLLSDEELRGRLVVKIDVEGAESAVLNGILEDSSRLPPETHLAIEVHSDALAKLGSSAKVLAAAFAPLGFKAGWLPVDISEEAHMRRADVRLRTDEMPATGLVHLVLSRTA